MVEPYKLNIMKNTILRVFVVFLFSLLVISCSQENDSQQKNTSAPVSLEELDEGQIKSTNQSEVNFLQKAMDNIKNAYSVTVSENALIINKNIKFESGTMRVVGFEINGYRYGASYFLSGELVALTSQHKISAKKTYYTIKTDEQPDLGFETNSDCEQASGESCAGCNYRQMMEIIESNGDLRFICDVGNRCNNAVMTAAVIHCAIKH